MRNPGEELLCARRRRVRGKGEGRGRKRNGELILSNNSYVEFSIYSFLMFFPSALGLQPHLSTTKTPHPSILASAEQEVCCRRRGDGCYRNWCLLPLYLLLPLSSFPLLFSTFHHKLSAYCTFHNSSYILYACAAKGWSGANTDRVARSFFRGCETHPPLTENTEETWQYSWHGACNHEVFSH